MLTFKDDRLLRRLRAEFIPVTANTQELEWHGSPAQRFYTALVERTRAEGLSDTLDRQMSDSLDPQGMYILGPDGTPYGFTNDHEPADILRFMNQGLRRWREQPPREVEISDRDVAARWTAAPPAGTVVIRVYARIRPLPAGVWGLNKGVGRDYLWIYPEDQQALWQASAGGAGSAVALPAALVGRIVRFHLIDDVRGTPDMWTEKEVQRAEVRAQVMKESGPVRTIRFEASFAMAGERRSAVGARPKGTQSYEGRIEGELELETVARRVVRFRAFSDGQAAGEGTYTPYPPAGSFRLIIGMVEAAPEDQAAQVVPPEAVVTAEDDLAYRAARLP